MAGRALSSSSGSSASAAILLSKQFKQMQTVKDIPGISCGLVGNSGFFKAKLAFPPTYPHMPPSMTFTTPLFHPNIYPTGSVCISILHPPEDDKYGYESAAERWSPVQTPESILLSVISMLGSPNDESPANPEAGRLWREDKKEYRKRVRKCVRDSQESGEE
ncbi:Ubiquitin-conjugating enzyme E2 15 [Elasticomyces elasticus]|nr:Ubiquitin-conjugating enzyme E2 15 [Elasticomyces elasticus]